MKFEKSKILIWLAVAFLVVGGVMIARGGGKFVAVENPDEELKGEAYNRYWERLNEEYKKDNYGGATPEETLNLFIEALKAGDLELASKYFVVEKQESFLEDIKVGQKNGVVEQLLTDLNRVDGGFNTSSGGYRFETFDTSGLSEFSYDLILNTHTNKWKMYEL